MSRKQQLPKSVRTFIRNEKARIRKTVSDEKEQDAQILVLMKQYLK